MAIQPIDLQTLFTQVEKVGKSQASQKEGLAIQQALQGVQIQRKTEEQIQSVNETQDTGEGAEKVNDRGPRKNKEDEEGREKGAQTDAGEAEEGEGEDIRAIIRDPALGRNIDISG
ncbi:MAG: hypothetical protein LBD78_04120 [Spirochaetaceae bacterium]|jgi:hypothetical protein|nr:hypothetical protein [Spirochaetaceae bacterium]